jgi:ERCC4-type nuclease
VELLIARNPDPDSALPYLLRVPLSGGLVFRTSGTWPRTKALYCYPVPAADWPAEPELVERVGLRSCARRGASIDLVLDRGRENRSQLVFTKARGRDAVFWQSARTRKQARPNVATPTARAAGVADLEIVVDSHERYAYRFANQQVSVRKQALPCGDYGVHVDGRLVAAVERKSLVDLVASLTTGKLKFAVAELAALPRAAVAVEDRYSQVFKLERVRPAVVADGLAEIQVAWPNVPIVFCETRALAEEWTYRFLAAAQVWTASEAGAVERMAAVDERTAAVDGGATRAATGSSAEPPMKSGSAEPTTAQVRAWALDHGLEVSDRGRLRPQVWDAWRAAH